MNEHNALRLAKWLDAMPSSGYALSNQAAAELRRLHEEKQKLQQQLGEAVWNYGEKVRVNQELLEALKAIRNSAYMPQALIGLIDDAIAKGEQA